MEELYLGVEIGCTKQQLALCAGDGRILERKGENVPHPSGAKDILAWLETQVNGMLARHPGIRRIGVGFGGPLETATGRVLVSVQVPGWKDFALKAWFEERFGREAVVVNDTVAGGYAELKLGSGRQSRVFFYTNIGSGIGGALFIGGKTWDGTGFGASYLGNTYTADWTAREPGALCRIEALCCGPAIEARLRAPGYVPEDSALIGLCGGNVAAADCRLLRRAAEAGDAFALGEIARVGRTFGVGVATVVSLIGADTVAIGGGVANLGELLLSPMREAAEAHAFVSARGRFRIVRCALVQDNVPVGAALYARDGFDAVGI